MHLVSEDLYRSIREDPLFAAEGMDIERAEAALNALEQELGKLQRTLATRSPGLRAFFMLRPLARSAVPLKFLRAFVDCERKRRMFLAYPTHTAGSELLLTWLRTAHTYRRSVQRYARLQDSVFRHEPGLTKKLFHDMTGNTFTSVDVRSSVERLSENANLLEREAAERIQGVIVKPPPPFSVPRPVVAAPLSQVEHFMVQLEEERLLERYDILERLGPLGYTLSHYDGAATAHQFVLHLCENRTTHEPYFSLFVADHFMFLPIGKGTNTGRLGEAVFRPAIERGIRFFLQQPTWFYAMRDVQYVPELLTCFDLANRPLLDRALVDSQRSSLFDLIIWRTADDLRRYTQMTRVRMYSEEHKNYSLGHAFLMQTHPSLFFLPFNRSVWRLEEPLSMLGSGRTKKEERLYVPLAEISPPLSPEELRDAVMAGVIRRQAWEKQGIGLDDH